MKREKKVQSDLQNRESEITAMRKKSFMQTGGISFRAWITEEVSDQRLKPPCRLSRQHN